jgi:nitrilase
MSVTRVAVVQAGSILFDSAATLAKAERLISEAARSGARLLVFPEAFIGGYPKGADFGARVGSRTLEGRKLFRRYFEDAVDVPGPATLRLGEAARAHGVWLVIGVIERDGGTLYCTALFFNPEGVLAGKHRKVMPTAMERLIWGFGDASTLPVIETGFGRIGAVICWENYMPLLRAAMYAKGVQIYCAPTVDDREVWQSTMRHIALEGRCFVLSACQWSAAGVTEKAPVAPVAEKAPVAPVAEKAPVAPVAENIGGGSLIVGPLGHVLAGPHYEGECTLTADIDVGETAEGKFDLDVVGHYSRPDLFRLVVNE